MKTKTSLILTVAALALSGSALAEVKIALVAKSLGNGFFEAANVGAQQAAKELGDVKVIYTGPTTTTAEAQIDVLLWSSFFGHADQMVGLCTGGQLGGRAGQRF
ncbi:hypothetical protein M2S37_25050, partial [Klebsiella pneumoniae]|nr:hypothetical protein [Klebsiella pneumoniae]